MVSFFLPELFHPPEITLETFIAYRVLEVFPRGRRVLITCHSPQASPPVTYTLWGSQDTEVAKKVVKTRDPASFSINITLKSRPELLTYSCQAASNWGVHRTSAKLQMYWELWASEHMGCWGGGHAGCRSGRQIEAPGVGIVGTVVWG